MMDYKKVIKNRELRLKIIRLLSWIPDRPYLKMVYKIKTGQKLNLDQPVGYNEKINWLKLNKVNYNYGNLVDKFEVKKIVDGLIGEGHTIPTLGIWSKFEDIDFNQLPTSFVLKCTHDSGSVKVISKKEDINYKKLNKFYSDRLRLNAFCLGREYPYKYVKPRIIAEPLLSDLLNIKDYKFLCFNGIPKYLYVASNRSTNLNIDYFDMDFNHLNLLCECENSSEAIDCPVHFEEMKEIASKLSKNMPFVRVDLYDIDDNVYFGEYTFFDNGGFYLCSPAEWEKKLGDCIEI